jgi:hypothetical protein
MSCDFAIESDLPGFVPTKTIGHDGQLRSYGDRRQDVRCAASQRRYLEKSRSCDTFSGMLVSPLGATRNADKRFQF